MGDGIQRARAAARRTRNTSPEPTVGSRWRDSDTRPHIVRELVILERADRDKKSRGGENDGTTIKVPSARCRVYLAGKDTDRETWIADASFESKARKYAHVGQGAPPQMPGSEGSK